MVRSAHSEVNREARRTRLCPEEGLLTLACRRRAMPANLTPDYDRADQRYRAATTDDERLEALREMFAVIPKHKGTEKLQADLKRRISQFRKAVAKKPAKGVDPFHVPRAGAGQVVIIGPPNVGKSLLVARTTHAPVKVADYPYTTA